MDKPVKHYKFINSKTDNVIYYYSVESNLDEEQITEKLNVIKQEVAVTNGIFLGTVYWEEIKNED